MQAAPERPLSGPEAFTSLDDEAVQAQAAILLGIGMQLRGDRQKVEARAAAVAFPAEALMQDELAEFPIPRLAPAAKRYSLETLESRAGARFGIEAIGGDWPERRVADVAADVFETRTNSAAALLAETCLDHPHPLVRVAAANAALPVTTRAPVAVDILAAHVDDADELVRDVAATSLARYMPEHPALASVGREGGGAPLIESPTDTTMLIHGTWARNNAWYQPPGGDFWTYIRNNVASDLYGNSDFFRWSGGYSNGARDLAADQLVAWIRGKNENGISLMAHSHGGSAVMLATWRGVTLGRVVLLSCPVHPARYSFNFAAVQRVVSIRVKADLVLLADGSASRFTDPRYNEHVLPIWFNHSATHHPNRWTQFNIPAML